MLAGGDGERWSDHREDSHKSEESHGTYAVYLMSSRTVVSSRWLHGGRIRTKVDLS